MQWNALGSLQIKTTKLQEKCCISGSLTDGYGCIARIKLKMRMFVNSRLDLGGLARPFRNPNPRNPGNEFCIILSQGACTAKDNFCFNIIV